MSFQELPLITDANEITLANCIETYKELSNGGVEKGGSDNG